MRFNGSKVWLAISGSTLLAAFGCKGGECTDRLPAAPELDPRGPGDAPRLLSGRFVDRTTLELRFTKTIAPTDGVDPSQFRLSAGRGITSEGRDLGRRYCDQYTYYFDLSADLDDYWDWGYSGEEERVRITGLANVTSDPDSLELTLSPPLDPYRCLQLEYAADDDVGIFVHYAGHSVPNVEDIDGNALEDIAPHWALSGEVREHRGGLYPAMDAFVPIPCPKNI